MIALKLLSTAEYALRAMSMLALLPNEQAYTGQVLSERTHVPLHYLLKVMRKLVSAGLVDSSKGHGGGFRLARKPEQIAYGSILEAVGYEKQDASCVFGWGKCRDTKPCPMHGSWNQLNQLFITWAETTTLDHIVRFSDAQGISKNLTSGLLPRD